MFFLPKLSEQEWSGCKKYSMLPVLSPLERRPLLKIRKGTVEFATSRHWKAGFYKQQRHEILA